MKQSYFTIRSNNMIARSVYKMVLVGDTSGITAPGQFVNLLVDGCFLRRPISVCDVEGNELTIIYKVVGKGTEKMARMVPGFTVDELTGLGNGYNLGKSGAKVLLIGGGVGVPPLFMLAKALKKQGKDVTVILGFNKKEEIFYETEFKEAGCITYVATADGSVGTKGFVTDVMNNEDIPYTYFYTCGPLPMLKAIYANAKTEGEMSFEERMGCGFGACMGCSIKTKKGNKRICKDGPVLEKEEILW